MLGAWRTIGSRHGLTGVLMSALAMIGSAPPIEAAEREFPFDREMILDANPMRGSKRIPNLEIAPNGAAVIYLWCVNGQGHATIAEATITIVPTALRDNQCPPDRMRVDEELLTALTQVTGWRREGNVVTLIGPKTLRFRLATN